MYRMEKESKRMERYTVRRERDLKNARRDEAHNRYCEDTTGEVIRHWDPFFLNH